MKLLVVSVLVLATVVASAEIGLGEDREERGVTFEFKKDL